MVLDLLSTDMYAQYNVKLAHRIGLHAAIYLGELLNVSRKALQKGKLVEGNFFRIDREWVEKRTTLNKKEQREIDTTLEDLNIIHLGSNKETLNIDTDALTGLLLDDNASLVDKITQPVIKKKRLTKQEVIINSLKDHITTDNNELRKAYEEWIDAVCAKQGWMSSASIREGQTLIDNYTNRDLDMALKIINIGSINGWRDLSWAINDFEKKYKNSFYKSISNPSTTVSNKPSSAKPNNNFSDEVF